MRAASLLAVFALVSMTAAEDAKTVRLSFEGAPAGALPRGWKAAKTGTGAGSVWSIVEDKEAPGGKAVAQTSAAGFGSLFNLCLNDEVRFTDLDATFSVKPVAGKADQGGGFLWRCKDADNYYIARWNPLEDNYRFYKVVDGKRSAPIADAKIEVPAKRWHTMRIVCQGERVQCYLDGKLYIDEKDATFKDAGKIGFWTKADAQTRFANLQITGK